MAISRQKKEEITQELSDKLKKANIVIITDYKGISVAEMNELRGKMYEKGIDYRIAKNTLIKLALKNAGLETDTAQFTGPVGLVFGYSDQVETAKMIAEFAKGHEAMGIKFGIMEGEQVKESKIRELAALPSREELYARVAGSIAAPLRGLVGVLQGNLRSIVYVLNAYKDKMS